MDQLVRSGGAAALRQASRFFAGDDPVHRALRAIASQLTDLGIPYAIAGGMALVAHGYRRTTIDVDVLVTSDGLRTAHEHLKGLGYSPSSRSNELRDTRTGVRIEFLVSGQFRGDGKPKPVSFPEPSASSTTIEGVRYLTLPALIELKLASGMTGAGRLKDLADVQELIRILNLPADLSMQLNPYVRAKYSELWNDLHRRD